MVGGIVFFKKFWVEVVVGPSIMQRARYTHPFLVSPTTDRLVDPFVMGVAIILLDMILLTLGVSNYRPLRF